jgi:asparagine synthase (glutamine-hydrolysing)
MQNQLLRDSDIMSMAHGVEIRVPFLDKDFINLTLQIKPVIKYAGNFKKQMLIDAFNDLLPEPIWNRPKMGFSFPFKEWLSKNEFVKSTVYSSGNSAKALYKQFIDDKMHWSQLLTLVLLQKHAKA